MLRRRPYRPGLPRSSAHERVYGVRILAALAGSLALVVLVLRLWPAPGSEPEPARFEAEAREAVPLELIVPTRQAARQAPPPPPALPPVEVPDEVALPEEELDFEAFSLDFAPVEVPGPPGPPAEAEEEGPLFVESAEVRPRIVRSAVPDYPAEAQRRGVRARVRLRVLIDERGAVLEREITERFLLDGRGHEEEAVEALGFGIEEAVLEAVGRFRFRPGRHAGRPVQTYTVITLSVGI